MLLERLKLEPTAQRQNLYHDKRAQWAMYVVAFGALATIPVFMGDDPFARSTSSRATESSACWRSR